MYSQRGSHDSSDHAFRYADPFIAKRSLTNVAVQSLIIRGVCYALLGIAMFVPGDLFIIPSLIFFPLSSGIAYGLYYTASNTNDIQLHPRKQSQFVLGCVQRCSGYGHDGRLTHIGLTSVYLGFQAAFIIAGAILALALITAKLSNGNPTL